MKDVVIVSAVRTPVGKFQGALAEMTATELGAVAVREAVKRAGIDPASVDECLMGCVLPAGLGQNPARQAALQGGLPDTVSAMTINMVCGSGLKAVALAAQAVMAGDAEIVVAGGMESMTNGPYLLPPGRKGFRMGDSVVVDSMVKDGLWCACEDYHMGITGENVAEKHSITREEQDAYALTSHRKARAALKPAFRKDGTVTAGNAPGVNDAAAAVVVMSAERAKELGLQPLVTIKAQATSGVAPKWVMLAPVTGVPLGLKRAGWKRDEVDLFELNEAFSVQALGVMKELGLDAAKVNVNGGAVAIGHPIGASGARVLVTLIYEMMRRDVHRGVAALCLGGGNSVALAVERG